MRKYAIALHNDNEVFIIEDYSKYVKDKDDIIFEFCSKEDLRWKYLYWEHLINYKKYEIN